MPDPFYDEIIAIALSAPGVWLADDQGPYGLRFTTRRLARETLDELIPRFHERAWRTNLTAHRDDHSTVEVVSEIDRAVSVYVSRLPT